MPSHLETPVLTVHVAATSTELSDGHSTISVAQGGSSQSDNDSIIENSLETRVQQSKNEEEDQVMNDEVFESAIDDSPDWEDFKETLSFLRLRGPFVTC